KLPANRPIHDDKRGREMRRSLNAVNVQSLVANSTNQWQQDLHHSWFAPGHHRVSSNLLDSRLAIAGRYHPDDLLRITTSHHSLNTLLCRRNYWKRIAELTHAVLIRIFRHIDA